MRVIIFFENISATLFRKSWLVYSLALTFFLLLGVAANMSRATSDGGGTKPEGIKIYVTDFGIDQWRPEYKMYQDFSGTDLENGVSVANHAVPAIPREGQILIPMPRESELPPTPENRAMRINQMGAGISRRISDAAAKGIKTFEIQLAQDIDIEGYMDSNVKQAECGMFVNEVYQAIAIAKSNLARERPVTVHGIFGSNGGYQATEQIPKLQSNPFDSIVLVSPRAFVPATIATYRAMNGNMSIINESGDCPAWSYMVANHDAAIQVASVCPRMKLYFVTTGENYEIIWDDNLTFKFPGHVKTMKYDSEIKNAKQWNQSSGLLPGYHRLKEKDGFAIIEQALLPADTDKPLMGDAQLGGIDLSGLEMIYLASSPSDNAKDQSAASPLPLFSAYKFALAEDRESLREAQDLSMDAFNIFLAIDPAKFWVNLNPNEPNRILDAQLAQTDIGRIMLTADLQLKKDAAALTNPQTSAAGREYWRKVRALAGVAGNVAPFEIQVSSRFWIVPGRIVCYGDDQEIYLVEATLEVKLETEHFKSPDSGPKALNASDKVTREMVLPVLNDAVNSAPQYAELRQVFRSMIFACWYRQRHKNRTSGSQGRNFDISHFSSHQPWDYRQIFNAYLKSVREGEYNFTEETEYRDGDRIYIIEATYFRGGVDFTHLKIPAPHSTSMPHEIRELIKFIAQDSSGVVAMGETSYIGVLK